MNTFIYFLSYFLLNEKIYDLNTIKKKVSKENILMYGLIYSLNNTYIFIDDYKNLYINSKFKYIKDTFINPLFLSKNTCDYNIDIIVRM